jgi:hypothetical protein
VPVSGSYTVYTFIADVDGNVLSVGSGTFSLGSNTFHNIVTTFPSSLGLPDGVNKVRALAIANTNCRVAFSPEYYGFRITPSGSSGCCP